MRCKLGLFCRPQPKAPSDVANLTGWWDASDASTLYNATTGGSLVAADGQIQRWQDKSGNGRHFIKDYYPGPTRKTSVRNSRDVVRFDGTENFLASNGWTMGSLGSSSGFTVVAALNAEAISTNASSPYSNVVLLSDNWGVFACFYFKSAGTVGVGLFDGTEREVSTAYTANTWAVVSFVYTGSEIQIRLNGASLDSEAVSASSWLNSNTAYAVHLGEMAGFNNFFDGDLGELVTYNAGLSAGDRESVETYLMDKWAIT